MLKRLLTVKGLAIWGLVWLGVAIVHGSPSARSWLEGPSASGWVQAAGSLLALLLALGLAWRSETAQERQVSASVRAMQRSLRAWFEKQILNCAEQASDRNAVQLLVLTDLLSATQGMRIDLLPERAMIQYLQTREIAIEARDVAQRLADRRFAFIPAQSELEGLRKRLEGLLSPT